MSGRYQPSGPLDEATWGDNDANFLGVNMRADPIALTTGMVSQAVNMVFRQGVAEPRRGFGTKPWGRQLGVNFNINFPFSFTNAVGFGKVYGATTFADPNGEERQILACRTKAWNISPNAPPTIILYPSGVEITEPVTFTQAFQVLIMWRGKRANPLKLDTALQFSFEMKWEEVPDETNLDYTSTIPDADRGCCYGNRVWVAFNNAEVAFSDILAYTRYDAQLSTIWVNDGESDILLSLWAYGENSLIAFKSRSIYAIVNALPSPRTSARTQILTRQRGLLAPDSVAQVGRDLWFLSDDGVYVVSQVFENALQANTEPVSAPMDPLMRRVHWGPAERAQGIHHDAKYFLAVPIDGSTYNNVILVYDFLNAQWSGHWVGPFIDVAFFLRIDIAGHRRLAFVSGDAIAGNEGHLYVLGDGYHDESFGDEADIETELLTRGYSANFPIDKIFLSCGVEMATWNGAGEITVVRDGVNEQATLVSYEKDRLKYGLFAKRNYDPQNLADNFLDPYRQDYSVALIPAPGPGVDNYGIKLGTGIVLGLHQYSSERMRIRQDSRHVQLRILGTRGRNNVRAVSLQAHADFIPLRSTI
jgi:hypothetical protein